MKHDDSDNKVFYIPEVVYNMSANSSGDIIELLTLYLRGYLGRGE